MAWYSTTMVDAGLGNKEIVKHYFPQKNISKLNWSKLFSLFFLLYSMNAQEKNWSNRKILDISLMWGWYASDDNGLVGQVTTLYVRRSRSKRTSCHWSVIHNKSRSKAWDHCNLTISCLDVTKGHTYLNKPAVFSF